MKNIYLFLITLVISATTFGQAPEGMSYQAVIKDAQSRILVSKRISIKISIIQDSENGKAVYTETQSLKTNSNGLVSLTIGKGDSQDNFSDIDWSLGTYYIKSEVDPKGGNNYSIKGTSQLLSVPYALYAKTAEQVTGNGKFSKAKDGKKEIDPHFTASPAGTILNSDISNWNSGIATNASDISVNSIGIGNNTTAIATLETEQETQDIAIALNTAKVGITSAQAITVSNTTGINTGDQEISGIGINKSKILTIRNEQAIQNSAIALNTAKTGITTQQANEIAANTIKIGLPVENTIGEMLYWDGTAWVSVAPGITNQTLSYCNGVPTWGPCLATVVTTTASSIESTTATSGGNIINSGTTITARGICWGLAPNPTLANNTAASGSGTGVFTAAMSGLLANTTYHVRAYATNSAGTVYGEDVVFNTVAESLATLTTTAVSNIGSETVYSGGNISNAGGVPIISRGVCWSTSPNPTIADNYTTDGSGIGSYTSSITGLSLSTQYYVRAYATNSAGTGYGNQVTFTTLSSTVPTIGSAYLGGVVAYIYQPGDPGYVEGETHGLIAALSDLGTAQWLYYCTGFSKSYNSQSSVSGIGLGTGALNTNKIISQATQLGCDLNGKAAKLCYDYSVTESGVVYDDWFLPSQNELLKLVPNRAAIGNFGNTIYWSSTQRGTHPDAYAVYFTSNNPGLVNYGWFNDSWSVRPVRYF